MPNFHECKDYPYTNVKVRPWIGRDYGTQKSMFRKRILIVGESYYRKHENPQHRWDTQWCIEKDLLTRGAYNRYWKNIVRMFLGDSCQPHSGESRHFWKSVAYYNFVQHRLEAGVNGRPSPKMWRDSFAAFREVLQKHAPEYIVVLGFVNWGRMPTPDKEPMHQSRSLPQTSKSDIRQTYYYKTRRGDALAIAVKHPSRAFNVKQWREWLRQVLRLDEMRRKSPKSRD